MLRWRATEFGARKQRPALEIYGLRVRETKIDVYWRAVVAAAAAIVAVLIVVVTVIVDAIARSRVALRQVVVVRGRAR